MVTAMPTLGIWRRQRTLAVTALVGVAGVGAVALPPLLDHPEQITAAEVDGRTWLALRRGSGPSLVLANGISGLVEAQATSATALPGNVRFAGSDQRFTLLRSPDRAVVVADGSHAATVTPLDRGGTAALVDQSLLSIGERLVIRQINAAGEVQAPVTLDGAGEAVNGAQPVVDDHGHAWVLRQVAGNRRAVKVGPGGVEGAVAVDDTTSELLVVDGRALARSGSSLVGLDGRGGPDVGAGAVIPTVAVSTGGIWATATDTSIEMSVAGAVRRVVSPRPVTRLAVWYGNVWATTDRGVLDTSGAAPAGVPGIDGPTSMFADGGRLWFVNSTTAAAVDRDQNVTVFRLAAVDLDLCVGDCTADDAVKYGKDHLDVTTTTSPAGNDSPDSAPSPVPVLTLPPLIPAAASTTTTSTIAPPPTGPPVGTEPAQPPGRQAATTTAPEQASPPRATSPPNPSTPEQANTTSSSVAFIDATLAPPLPTEPAGSTPGQVENSEAPPASEPPAAGSTTSSTSSEPGPSPSTTDPRPQGDVILYFTDGSIPLSGNTTTVALGFTGSAQDCESNGGHVSGGHTVADVAWDGSTTGRQRVAVDFGTEAETAIDIAAGSVTVSVSVCGLRATVDRQVSGEALPELDQISLSTEPAPNTTVTANAAYRYTPGWVPSSRWTFGQCQNPGRVDGTDGPDSTSATLTFAESGRYCVSLTVTFRRQGDRAVLSTSRRVDVGGSVDTTPVSTSTTTDVSVPDTGPPATDPPPPTVAQTDPPATEPTSTEPTSTEPPTTVAPTTTTTRPPPTDPPTTTTTAAPATTTPTTATTTTTTTGP